MVHDTGSLSAGDRLERLEEVHSPKGACEERHGEIWQAIGNLRERMKAVEVKIAIYAGLGAAFGAALVEFGKGLFVGGKL